MLLCGAVAENGDFDPARAMALLDLYGHVDKNGDGWHDLRDGKPLVLDVATQPDQTSRQHDELCKKNMERICIQTRFFPGKWPEQLEATVHRFSNDIAQPWLLG